MVQKRAYQQRPARYEYLLTEKGVDLFDVIVALVLWGGRHTPGSVAISKEQLASMDPRPNLRTGVRAPEPSPPQKSRRKR